MTLTGPAYLRASFALSPAGTRKTSTPARRTPIVFCFDAADRADRAVERRARRSPRPCSRGRRRGRAPRARRARTRARPTGRRSSPRRSSPGTAASICAAWLDEHADRSARFGSLRVGDRLHADDLARALRRSGRRAARVSPGLCARASAGAGRRSSARGLPSTATIDLGRLEPAPSPPASRGATSSTSAPVGCERRPCSRGTSARPRRRCPASAPSPAGPRPRRWLSLTPGGLTRSARDERLAAGGRSGRAARRASPGGRSRRRSRCRRGRSGPCRP